MKLKFIQAIEFKYVEKTLIVIFIRIKFVHPVTNAFVTKITDSFGKKRLKTFYLSNIMSSF
jgi:hypothetical protein